MADIHLPLDVFDQLFGGERDAGRAEEERRFFLHEMRATTHWQPDLATLHSSADRIVVAVGGESAGQIAERTSRALAAALGLAPVEFPGGHTGFVDEPEAFAGRLRTVL